MTSRARRPKPGAKLPDTDPLQRGIGSRGRAPLEGGEPGQVGPDWIEQPGPQPDSVNVGDLPADRGGRVLNPNPGGGLPGQGSGGVPGRLRGDVKRTPQAPKTTPQAAEHGVTPGARPKDKAGG